MIECEAGVVWSGKELIDPDDPETVLALPCGFEHQRQGEAMKSPDSVRNLEQFFECGPADEVVQVRSWSVDLAAIRGLYELDPALSMHSNDHRRTSGFQAVAPPPEYDGLRLRI